MSQEQAYQKQEHPSGGYQDQAVRSMNVAVKETEYQCQRTLNGYEFWLKVFAWIEENWLILLVLWEYVFYPLLSALIHLITGK